MGSKMVVGRGDECHVVLQGHEISRQHAALRREGPLLIVEDLRSTNGTFVNGRCVDRAPLAVGDVVRLGGWLGIVERAADDGSRSSFGTYAPGLYAGPVSSAAIELARRAAPSDLPVVVEGETGTGKEGLCRALHAWSGRKGPFIAFNCAAIAEGMAEGELFGYRQGAFTGAVRSHLGHFRAADGGTLMLDEIVDMPLPLQAKLLRVLEQREVVPLGESLPTRIDVRVVAAAQSSLSEAVASRRFRADLAARLDGVTVRLPPLRERIVEIPFVFMSLLQRYAGDRRVSVDAKLIERLCLYDWPFNVRELDLLVRRLLLLHAGEGPLRREHLPEKFATLAATAPEAGDEAGGPAAGGRNRSKDEQRMRDERELDALLAALREHRGNVARSAAAAGITRQRAYRLMEMQTDVDLDGFRRRRRESVGIPSEPRSDAEAPDAGGR